VASIYFFTNFYSSSNFRAILVLGGEGKRKEEKGRLKGEDRKN
jgi:hypothetical protein